MSYDVHLEVDLGGPEPVRIGALDANYTWNVYPMFSAAGAGSPNDWDGLQAEAVARICAGILDAFDKDPGKFRALNPANGWGDYEGARAFIQTIYHACCEAPRATVRVG